VLARANTLDMYVLDVGTRWIKYQQDKEEGRAPTSKQPTQEEMIAMVERAKQKQGASK
jgi:fatty acid-binding protein DegV